MSGDGRVTITVSDGVGTMVFDRPGALNAMTHAMYEQFARGCERLTADPGLRVVVLRGAGGRSFVAGSDIAGFLAFKTAEDGIAYEREMGAHLDALAAIPVPTLAVIEGFAVGGGLNIAAACDLRIATTGTKFGVPIARTLGNCLSMANYARLLAGFGEGRAKRMLLLGELLGAEEALAAGFLARIVAPEALDAEVEAITARLAANAPLTMKASKAALGRLQRDALPDADDLIRLCYGSADFRAGVRAFVDKSKPDWRGR